jgi:hypothetical protein
MKDLRERVEMAFMIFCLAFMVFVAGMFFTQPPPAASGIVLLMVTSALVGISIGCAMSAGGKCR